MLSRIKKRREMTWALLIWGAGFTAWTIGAAVFWAASV